MCSSQSGRCRNDTICTKYQCDPVGVTSSRYGLLQSAGERMPRVGPNLVWVWSYSVLRQATGQWEHVNTISSGSTKMGTRETCQGPAPAASSPHGPDAASPPLRRLRVDSMRQRCRLDSLATTTRRRQNYCLYVCCMGSSSRPQKKWC